MDDHEHSLALQKISVAGGGYALYGLTLNDWVAVFTIVYVVMQTILLLPKYVEAVPRWYRALKAWIDKGRIL